MKVRAPGATTQRKKAPAEAWEPTDPQVRTLNALMCTATRPGELWKWAVVPPVLDEKDPCFRVRCERWAGTKLLARFTYDAKEVARLGDDWPAHVLAALSDPWNPAFVEGIK